MPQVLDLHNLDREQAMSVAQDFLLGKFLVSFAEMAHAGGSSDEPLEHQYGGWTLSWRRQPTSRIQVRISDPMFYELVKSMLEGRGKKVRDKGDHLVVIL